MDIKNIFRIKRRTDPTNSFDGGFDTFSTTRANKFGNQDTWRSIYKNEPFVKGPVDAKVNATIGEWTLESITEKQTEKEKKLMEKIYKDLTNPRQYFKTKLKTISFNLILETIVYLETSRDTKKFYILDSKQSSPHRDSKKELDGISWKPKDWKTGEAVKVLKGKEYAMISQMDMDTEMFMQSALETAIDIANILHQSRRYNLELFKNDGVPSLLYSLPDGTSDPNYQKFLRKIKRGGRHLVSIGKVGVERLAGFNKDMEYSKQVDYAVQSLMTLLNVSPQIMSLAIGNMKGSSGESSRQEMNAFGIGVHSDQRLINDLITQVIHNNYSESEEEPIISSSVGKTKNDPVYNIRFKLNKWVDIRQLAAIHKIYSDIQGLTQNEIRAEIGREPVEGGDKFVSDVGPMGNTGNEDPSGQGDNNDTGDGDAPDNNVGDSTSQDAENN